MDRTIWRHRFGGGFGPVVRQNTEWMNESSYLTQIFLFQWLFVYINFFLFRTFSHSNDTTTNLRL